jgi:exo-1,4-beta-D-glucosaminidase
LSDAGGKELSDNFYWLSIKADTLNWAKQQDTVYTPQAEFGDLTGLNSLPLVKLKTEFALTRSNVVSLVNLRTESAVGNGEAHVTVTNPSSAVAFMVHLRVTRGKGGEDLTPIFWEDNYFSLLPGESRTVTAKFGLSSLGGKEAVVELDGWNVVPATLGAPQN